AGSEDPGTFDLDDRDFVANETILSGDLNNNDNPATPVADLRTEATRADNCYHVFYHPDSSPLSDSAVLDGFTITGGNANGTAPHNSGGGIYHYHEGDPLPGYTLANCTFTRNSAVSGGGIYNRHYLQNINAMSAYILTDCTFTNNSASGNGGGLNNNRKINSQLTGCKFRGNVAGDEGGGMYDDRCMQELTNCTFIGNVAGTRGGGLYNGPGYSLLTNCIFSGNSAFAGAAIYNWAATFTITSCTFAGNATTAVGTIVNQYFYYNPSFLTNCIFWDNSMVTEIENILSPGVIISNCDIGGCGGSGGGWDTLLGLDGGGNIDTDPLFVDADGADNMIGTEDDDLRLQADSPCIDTGDNSALRADMADLDGDGDTAEPIPFDLDGNVRIISGTVDMGAYEYYLIELLSPNGSEAIIAGTIYDITWQAVSSIENVSLEYSDANGLAWTSIDPNTPNDGEYDWTAPDITSDKCLVRVSDAIDPNVFDVSDDMFTIYVCQLSSPADLNNDCETSMPDLGIMSAGWPDVYDFNDLTILADDWLRNGNPFDPDFTEIYEGMAFIPSGEFLMGDHHDGRAPVHAVYLDSFYMSRYEVTNRQYCDYLNSAYPGQLKVVGGVVYASTDTGNSYP
ncbi:MAG: SUMF1/EgtB/PvdO family nonheme iron enzyme, partial [Planctomycetes bacterium]|nr:SUMF1/EgtB/PvdO family nonheme iron enzyme [Planctomycetota bacterium]